MAKYCVWCGTELDPEWAVGQRKFCSRRCLNAEWYSRNKPHHRKIYKKAKREWEVSQAGKRAHTSMYHWWKLPKWFRS